MKKIILMLSLILMASMVMAVPIELDRFRIYVDDENMNVDFEDNEEFIAYQGSTVQAQLRFENIHNETIANINIYGEISDIEGKDLIEEKEIEIEEGDSKTIVLDFYIPKETIIDNYNMKVKYDYTLNGTDYNEQRNFDIKIRNKPEEEMDYNEVLRNLTREFVSEKKTTNDLLSTVIDLSNLSNKYAVCAEDLADYENRDEVNRDYRSKFNNETNIRQDIDVKLATCQEQKKNMYTISQIESREEMAANKAANAERERSNNNMMWIGGAVLIIYLWNRNKKKVGGKGEGRSLKGATW